MGLFTNPLGYAGYPPGASAPATVVNSTVRAATAAEAAAGVLTDVYLSPATAQSSVVLDFASPPPLGNTAANTVASTTLTSSGNTSLGTGASSVVNVGVASSTIGFFGATAVVKPTSTTDLRTALINLGLYTTGGASPLNLNGGALTAGATTATTLGSTGNTALATGAGTTAALGNATGTLGFFGSAGATKVTQGAITNSVTVGGTTGTIADYSDLTVYANDAAAIRNDIYQLSLALANVVGALRSYGLLV